MWCRWTIIQVKTRRLPSGDKNPAVQYPPPSDEGGKKNTNPSYEEPNRARWVAKSHCPIQIPIKTPVGRRRREGLSNPTLSAATQVLAVPSRRPAQA